MAQPAAAPFFASGPSATPPGFQQAAPFDLSALMNQMTAQISNSIKNMQQEIARENMEAIDKKFQSIQATFSPAKQPFTAANPRYLPSALIMRLRPISLMSRLQPSNMMMILLKSSASSHHTITSPPHHANQAKNKTDSTASSVHHATSLSLTAPSPLSLKTKKVYVSQHSLYVGKEQ